MTSYKINKFKERVVNGELVIDKTHPRYDELESAIERYDYESGLVVASPDTIRDTWNAIAMATMRGVIEVRGAEALFRSEPSRPEEPVVQEVLRLIVTEPREATTTTNNTTNIQAAGDVEHITINYNNAIKEINSKNIPDESKSRLMRIVNFVRSDYSRIIPLVLDVIKLFRPSGQ